MPATLNVLILGASYGKKCAIRSVGWIVLACTVVERDDLQNTDMKEIPMSEHKGKCFCGAVEFSVSGEPVAMGFCHCESCRHWSAGPVNAFTLWKPDALTVTKGAGDIGTYNKTANSSRKWCKTCGGHVFTDHPPMKLVDVYAAILPTLAFKPALHVSYGEKVLSIKDGLPKMKDLPKEMGGSGITLPE